MLFFKEQSLYSGISCVSFSHFFFPSIMMFEYLSHLQRSQKERSFRLYRFSRQLWRGERVSLTLHCKINLTLTRLQANVVSRLKSTTNQFFSVFLLGFFFQRGSELLGLAPSSPLPGEPLLRRAAQIPLSVLLKQMFHFSIICIKVLLKSHSSGDE